MASHTAQADYNLAVTDTAQIIRISGLRWSNCSYDIRSANNGPSYDAFAWYMQPAVPRTFYLSNSISVGYFVKDSPQVNITIDLVRQHDCLPAQTANSFPACVFSFSIYPVD
jgi:hypothetical protein